MKNHKETSLQRRMQEGLFILLMAASIFLFVSLITYSPEDSAWSYVSTQTEILNATGSVGAWFSDICYFLFGLLAYAFPAVIAFSGILIFKKARTDLKDDARLPLWLFRVFGFALVVAAGCGLSNLHWTNLPMRLPESAGGVLGRVIGGSTLMVFNTFGATLLLSGCLLTGITFSTGLSWVKLCDWIGRTCFNISCCLKTGGMTIVKFVVSGCQYMTEKYKQRSKEKQLPVLIPEVIKKTKFPIKKKVVMSQVMPEIEPEPLNSLSVNKGVKSINKEQQTPLLKKKKMNNKLPSVQLLEETKANEQMVHYSREKLEYLSLTD